MTVSLRPGDGEQARTEVATAVDADAARAHILAGLARLAERTARA
jgi:hypothetical protein